MKQFLLFLPPSAQTQRVCDFVCNGSGRVLLHRQPLLLNQCKWASGVRLCPKGGVHSVGLFGDLLIYSAVRQLCLIAFKIRGPQCPARYKDRTTAPAPAGEARTSNRGSRYRRSRSVSRRSPRRRRPRSPAKPLPNFQPVPRGEEKRQRPQWPL